ncbi:TetR/AcrR family transcriptional regulator [Williamsia sp. M5A3_1d]
MSVEEAQSSADRPSRRDVIMAAAVTVLAERGPRGLTHRAVDSAAGLGAGAVNYHAPSRARLLSLAVEEVFRRDLETAARHFAIERWTHDVVVTAVVGFVIEMTSEPNRNRIIARHHLRGEALTNDELRDAFDVQQAGFVGLAQAGFETSGRPIDIAAAELFRMAVDGLMTRQVMYGSTPMGHEQVVAIAELIVPR